MMGTNMVDYYSLTHSQRRIWYVEQSHPGTSMWNNAGTLKIHGTIDFDLLDRAAQMFLERNESARLRICMKDGEPVQYVAPYHPIHIDRFDFSSTGVGGLYEWDTRQTQAPMSLIDNPLVYFALAKTAPDEGYLYAKMHHIISDGVSFVVLANEIMEAYDCLLSGIDPQLPEPVSYLTFVNEEQKYMESKRCARDKMYWLERFSDLPEPTVIKPRTADYFSTKAKRKACLLSSGSSEGIRAFCETHRTSEFSLLLAAFSIYLNRVLNKTDLVISAPVSNRIFAGSGDRFGMYVSTVPIRLSIDDGKTFKEFIDDVSDEWFSILKHQRYPYDLLIQQIHESNGNLDQLYDLSLSYQVGTFEKGKRNFSYEGRWHFSGHQASSLNIHLNDRENSGRLILDYDYLHPLFATKEVDFIHEHLCNLISDAIAHPGKRLFELNMLSPNEAQKVVCTFNDTDDEFPETDLATLWRKRVQASPASRALVYHGRTLTASDVDRLSDGIAKRLKAGGVHPDDVVALMLPRSDAYFIGLLGIIKAGAAFIPIDPALPAERVRYMLAESKAHLALRGKGDLQGWTGPLPEGVDTVLYDETPTNENACILKGDAPVPYTPNRTSVAYLIYTSGSTGTPKGVAIEHHSIAHFVYSMQRIWDRTRGGCMLAAGPISFDISVMEAAIGLFSERTLVVADAHEADYPDELCALIIKEDVDLMMVTPGRMEMLLSSHLGRQALHSFHEIGMGADILPPELIKRIQTCTSAHISNFYGPTEATIASTLCDVADASSVNIGTPMNGTHVYILDSHGHPLPIGVPGELYIGGAGVGRGYVAREELTEQRFLSLPSFPGERLYRTGDLGRWYPRGEIEFLGRIDRQVKLRGYRVELGEIQNRLLQIEGVRSAAVICHEEGDRKFLCGYLIGDDMPEVSQMKAQLAKSLPFYMIPAYLISLEKMPRTISGKLDLQRLPKPCTAFAPETPPQTDTQIRLGRLWENLLNIPTVGRDDHFFEIGGDSLSIVRMITEVASLFDVDIRLEDVYSEPTLCAVAALIDHAEAGYRKPVKPVPARRYQPTTPTQRQMFLVSHRDPDSIAYNVPALFLFEGVLDDTRLQAALEALIKRHPALRTSLHLRDSSIMQQIHRDVSLPFQSLSCADCNLAEYAEGLVRPFDLSKAPLVRMTAVHSDKRTILLFDFHHAVCDQVGFQLAMADFEVLYRNEKLAPLDADYKDCAVWMEGRSDSEAMAHHRAYWDDQLAQEIPPLDLPADGPRTGKRNGGVCQLEIPRDRLSSFTMFVRENKATTMGGLLTAFALVLSRMSEQEHLNVGIPVSGRVQAAMQQAVGGFINLLPIPCVFKDVDTVQSAFDRIAHQLGDALSHQDYPFEDMIALHDAHRDPLRNPLFDVMLVFGKGQADLALDDQRVGARFVRTGTSKLDLTLFVYESDFALTCRLEYDTDLFSPSRAARTLDRISYTLQTLFSDPNLPLCDADVLPPDERRLLLDTFSDTDQPYPKRMLPSWIEDIALDRPHSEAVVAADGHLDFAEFNQRVDLIARNLKAHDVTPSSLVALMMHRTVNLLPALFGIMKAGAAYVPIDPSYPAERISFMLEDCDAQFVMYDDMSAALLGSIHRAQALHIEEMLAPASTPARPTSAEQVTLDDPAYVIYTSGSTGLPKASLLTRKGIANLREALATCIGYNPSWTVASVTTMSFDIFMADAILPLTFGCRVVLADEEELRQPHLLAQLMKREKVDFLQTTPSRMQIMVNDGLFCKAAPRLRTLVLAGEKPSLELVRTCKRLMPNARIKNGYGPTEVTVYTSFQEMSDCDHVSIGHPIANTHVYLLDPKGRPAPLGSWAEAYISGAGVSPGYLGKPDLNALQFLPDPFHHGLTMYRSGDICRFEETGELLIAGRMDHQIKIRGQRIELGEVEAQLTGCPGVREAVAVVWGEEPRKQIAAFFVPDGQPSPADLRAQLATHLPAHMMPTRLIPLECLPMTANGKIDRKNLPDPSSWTLPNTHQDRNIRAESALSADQRRFLRVAAKVLGVDKATMDDDIFELGADSLAIISIQSKLIRYGKSVRTQDFYDAPILGDLYARIKQEPEEGVAEDTGHPPAPIANGTVSSTDAEIQNRRNTIAADSNQAPGLSVAHVIVTGATGFFGAHLVAQLIASGAQCIECLVRGKDDADARSRLDGTLAEYGFSIPDEKLRVRHADLSSDLSGLAASLKGTTTVFHCAALTEHVGKRIDYERANIEGTRHMLALSEALGAAFVHISTMSVAGLDGEPFDERSHCTGQNIGYNEYVRSKFLAEGLVLDAFGQGLGGRIFRIGNLTGRIRDGVFQRKVTHNAFAMRLAAFAELGCCPSGYDSLIELTPVDLCAQAAVLLATSSTANRILHLRSSSSLSLDSLAELMTRSGHPVETVPTAVFSQKAVTRAETDFNRTFGVMRDIVEKPAGKPTQASSLITDNLLRSLGFSWPKTDTSYMELYLSHFMEGNRLPSIG
jgi:fengycin family lipopeptide synthetase D